MEKKYGVTQKRVELTIQMTNISNFLSQAPDRIKNLFDLMFINEKLFFFSTKNRSNLYFIIRILHLFFFSY